jgi:flagellar basal body-associated protein FliL
MTDHPKQDASAAGEGHEKASGGGIVPWIAVGVISAGLGSAVPFLLADRLAATPGDAGHGAAVDGAVHGSLAQGAKPAARRDFEMPREEETVFLTFGEPEKDHKIVINLDEGRMSRYLRLAITLQIPKSQEETFKARIEAKKIVLRNWLLSKGSDLDLEDIRGAAGQNRLRREIRDHSNSVLCPDGYDQIYDVLFEEFNVQ